MNRTYRATIRAELECNRSDKKIWSLQIIQCIHGKYHNEKSDCLPSCGSAYRRLIIMYQSVKITQHSTLSLDLQRLISHTHQQGRNAFVVFDRDLVQSHYQPPHPYRTLDVTRNSVLSHHPTESKASTTLPSGIERHSLMVSRHRVSLRVAMAS